MDPLGLSLPRSERTHLVERTLDTTELGVPISQRRPGVGNREVRVFLSIAVRLYWAQGLTPEPASPSCSAQAA